MATFRIRASGSVEAVIRRKTLPGPIFLTFETMEKAVAYCKEAEALIDAGCIPPGLLDRVSVGAKKKQPPQRTIRDVIRDYKLEYAVKADDIDRLNVIENEIGDTKTDAITVQWATDIIRGYKIVRHLTPSTIRHRIGALRRCFDWAVALKGEIPLNPLRLLPQRYAVYNDSEISALAAAGKAAPDANNARDRRLEPGEEERIRKVLSLDPEYIKARRVERGLKRESSAPMTLLFDLALETAMRLREMYTLTVDQIDLGRKTIFLDKTKNGDKRQVPMTSVAVRAVGDYLAATGITSGALFPLFWDGDLSRRGLIKATSRMSDRWRSVARLAMCEDLHFHDLRHEATSRLFERTKLSDLKISKITGHKNMKMLARYANLRASDLADELW